MIFDDIRNQVSADGFAIVQRLFPDETLSELTSLFAEVTQNAGARQPHVAHPRIGAIARESAIVDVVESVLGSGARVVRSILFDKNSNSNWSVPWHQDLTIWVAERMEAPDFLGWSLKKGSWHTQAPREILENILTVRLHLDDCGAEIGPLRVLPGSHAHGWLDSGQIDRLKEVTPEKPCLASRGDALLMRPLLLHASSRALKPGRRRVLHLEYASRELPHGLKWGS